MNQAAAEAGLDHLSPAETAALSALRDRGWAVCIFAPWEMGNVKAMRVEDAMCEAGWRRIDAGGDA